MKYRLLTQHYSKLPYTYGFPKIHKDGIPLKSIVSNKGSACQLLSRFQVEIVTPLTVKSSSYVETYARFMVKSVMLPIIPTKWWV